MSSEPRLVTQSQTCFFLLICYVFQQIYCTPRARVGVLITDARCRALARVARCLVVDMIASEAFGGCGRLRVDDSMLSHVALASISLTRAFPCCAALVLAALSLSFTHFSCAVRATVLKEFFE